MYQYRIMVRLNGVVSYQYVNAPSASEVKFIAEGIYGAGNYIGIDSSKPL